MAEIVDFQKAKEEREPHATGPARCMACKHEWIAVAPMGNRLLDCPSCGTTKGMFVLPYQPDVYFECPCGNELFFATPDGVFCPNCAREDDPHSN